MPTALLQFVAMLGIVTSQAATPQSTPSAVGAPATAGAPAGPRWVRGTPIELMVTKEINSRTAKVGDQFRLRVNRAVVLDGATVIPVGATALAEVIAAAGTNAAGGKGQLSMRLLHVETAWGEVALAGAKGVEGDPNTAGVVLSVLAWGPLGLLAKGGNALFKAGDIIPGYIAEGEAPVAAPLVIAN